MIYEEIKLKVVLLSTYYAFVFITLLYINKTNLNQKYI